MPTLFMKNETILSTEFIPILNARNMYIYILKYYLIILMFLICKMHFSSLANEREIDTSFNTAVTKATHNLSYKSIDL